MLDSMLSQTHTPFDVVQESARLRTEDPAAIRADPSKLQKQTGWKPRIPIEETLRDVLDYYRSIRAGA
jgi:GDP-4-dehydro-6-deoxy-D-mannose reductase